MTTEKLKVERGSGNVFADLGRPDADTQLLKAELVTRIDKIVRQRGLKQVEAAELLGLSQPDISLAPPAGKFSGVFRRATHAPADGTWP